MNDKEKKTGNKLFDKLKNVKHIEIYIAVIFIIILLLIYLSNFKTNEKSNSHVTNASTVTEYIDLLEQDLEEILANIAGVSDVKVMITLNTAQIELTDSQINLTKFPDIKGIIITAKGVKNTSNKLKVLHAVESVVDISNTNIQILSSE